MPELALGAPTTWPQMVSLVERLQRLSRAAQRGTLADELSLSAAAATDPAALVRAVHAQLADLALALLQQAKQALSLDERRRREQALYAAVAVVDEALSLDLDWPGQALWPDHLLEHRLFQSCLAGRLFFERAELALCADASSAPEREVAGLFLLALQLGFKGRHRGPEGVGQIVALRQRLHTFATTGVAPKPPDRLMPQPYAHNLNLPRDPRIAPLRPWRRAALGLTLAWLFGSALWWTWLVQPLHRLSG